MRKRTVRPKKNTDPKNVENPNQNAAKQKKKRKRDIKEEEKN